MREPILINRLEDNNLRSILGDNGINNGAIFESGYFGNCARIDAVDENINFNLLTTTINPDLFTVEWWMNTDYSVTDGLAPNVCMWYHILSDAGGLQFFYISNISSQRIRINRTGNGYINLDNTSDWSAGVWKHFALVTDRSASFDGIKTLAIYIDGIQTGSVTNALSTLSFGANPKLIIGNYSGGIFPARALMENIKVHDYAKTDFSDRFDERGGLNDMAIIL